MNFVLQVVLEATQEVVEVPPRVVLNMRHRAPYVTGVRAMVMHVLRWEFKFGVTKISRLFRCDRNTVYANLKRNHDQEELEGIIRASKKGHRIKLGERL